MTYNPKTGYSRRVDASGPPALIPDVKALTVALAAFNGPNPHIVSARQGRAARARVLWGALQAGRIVGASAAAVRRDWEKEFKELERARTQLAGPSVEG